YLPPHIHVNTDDAWALDIDSSSTKSPFQTESNKTNMKWDRCVSDIHRDNGKRSIYWSHIRFRFDGKQHTLHAKPIHISYRPAFFGLLPSLSSSSSSFALNSPSSSALNNSFSSSSSSIFSNYCYSMRFATIVIYDAPVEDL